jgi:hypothetical protein
MSNRLAVVVAVSAVSLAAAASITSCSFGNGAFSCSDTDHTCGAGGTCQLSTGYCSFDDQSCMTTPHQRYGAQSGTFSGKCVDEANGTGGGTDSGTGPGSDNPDGGATTPPDAALFCYGTTGVVRVCYATAPTGTLQITAPTPLDTDNDPLCVAPLSGGNGYCVVAAATIDIQDTLRAFGSRPLVLVASGSITSNADGFINVSSNRTGDTELGAGHDLGTCTAMVGTAPTKRAGGAGGSFAGQGGNGSMSSDGTSTAGVAGNAAPTPSTAFRGGCSGQAGDGAQAGIAGHGGGAVFLIAGNKIALNSLVSAGGEGGVGGTAGGGAGGGGAGGMIGLDAPTITSTGTLTANGGGGAEGGGTTSQGPAGADATGTNAALGGANANSGADGGDGSAGAGAGGKDAKNNATSPGGGGGGGGGAGVILATHGASLGTRVSPPATILPQ